MSEPNIGTRLSTIGQHYVLGRSRREIAKNRPRQYSTLSGPENDQVRSNDTTRAGLIDRNRVQQLQVNSAQFFKQEFGNNAEKKLEDKSIQDEITNQLVSLINEFEQVVFDLDKEKIPVAFRRIEGLYKRNACIRKHAFSLLDSINNKANVNPEFDNIRSIVNSLINQAKTALLQIAEPNSEANQCTLPKKVDVLPECIAQNEIPISSPATVSPTSQLTGCSTDPLPQNLNNLKEIVLPTYRPIAQPNIFQSASYFLQRRIWGRSQEEIVRNRIAGMLNSLTNKEYDSLYKSDDAALQAKVVEQISTIMAQTYGERVNHLTPAELALIRAKFIRNQQPFQAKCFDAYITERNQGHSLIVADETTLIAEKEPVVITRKDFVDEYLRKKTLNHAYRMGTGLATFGAGLGMLWTMSVAALPGIIVFAAGVYRTFFLSHESKRVWRDNQMANRGDIAATENPAISTTAINLANHASTPLDKIAGYFDNLEHNYLTCVNLSTSADQSNWCQQGTQAPIK